MARPCTRFRGAVRVVALALAVGLPGAASAQAASQPLYWKHRADPAQQIFSRALLGMSIDRKCRFLSDAERSEYEAALLQADNIFQGYVVAVSFVPGPDQAMPYVRDMAEGASKFASARACDDAAQEFVRRGQRTARDFVPLLRTLFEAPDPTR